MKIRSLLLTALLGLASAATLGATPAPAAGTRAVAMKPHGLCATNPDRCAQLAAKFDKWCQTNSEKCTDFKARIEKRREWCEKNAAKCRAIRKHLRARMLRRRSNAQTTPSPGNSNQ